MNDLDIPTSPHGVPWPTSDERARAPDSSMLKDDAAPRPISALLRAREVPAMGEAPAAPASHDWTEAVRDAVRRHPLMTLAAAVALSAVIARAAR